MFGWSCKCGAGISKAQAVNSLFTCVLCGSLSVFMRRHPPHKTPIPPYAAIGPHKGERKFLEKQRNVLMRSTFALIDKRGMGFITANGSPIYSYAKQTQTMYGDINGLANY